MSSKVECKLIANDSYTLEIKIYIKKGFGWSLKRKYKTWFGLGKCIAIMTKEIPNG